MARNSAMLALAMVLVCAVGTSLADLYTYQAPYKDGFNSGTTPWDAAGAWDLDALPGANDTAVFANGNDYWDWTVNLNGSQSVFGLDVTSSTHMGYTFNGAGNTLTLGAGGLVIDNANNHVFNCLLAGNTSITQNATEWEWDGWNIYNRLALLNNSNSFTGPINISGILQITSDSALGNSTNVLTLGSAGAFGTLLAYNNASFTTGRAVTLAGEGGAFDPNYGYLNVNGPITGSGGLILWGAGGRIAVTGTADNSYSGGTRIWQTGAIIGMDTSGQNQTASNMLGSGNLRVEFGGAVTMNSAGNMASNATVYVGSNNMGSFSFRSIFLAEGFVPNFTSDSSGAFFWEGNSSAAINARLAYGQPQLGNGHMAYGGGGSSAGGLAFYNGRAIFTGTSLMADEIDHVYRFYGNIFTAQNSVLNDNDPAYHYGLDANGGCVEIGGENNTFSGTISATGVDNGFGSGGIINLQRGTLDPLKTPLGSATGDIVLSRFGLLKIEPQRPDPNTNIADAQLPIVKRDVYFNGVGVIDISSAYQYWHSELDVNSLVRNGRGVLYIMGQGQDGNPGFLGTDSNNHWGWAQPGAEILKVANAPASTNGMVSPVYVLYGSLAGSDMDFLNYGANGFVAASYTVGGAAQAVASQTDFNNAVSTDIVNVTAAVNTNSDPKTVYAVRAAGDISGSNTLTIGSGGLIAIGTRTISAPVNFGSAEGLVYASNGNSVYLQGGVAGANGLTFSAASQDSGNAGGTLYVYGHNSSLGGQITVNGGNLSFQYADSLGADSNPVLVNGGSFCPGYDGDVNRAITIGISGSQIGGWWNWAGHTNHYTQPITGPGTITVPWWAGNVYLDAVNSYSGGTRVYNHMYVDAGATTGGLADGSAGGGPIQLVNGGALYVYGTGGISQAQRVSLLREDTKLYVSCNGTLAIGSLEGYGSVYLNDTSGSRLFDSTLSIGSDETSTDFYGSIRNNDYSGGYGGEARGGNILKVGAGTLTLGGNNIYTGTTTVSGGVLNITGSIAAPPHPNNYANHCVYVNGGTLTGTGAIVRPVIVNTGGSLTGGLTIQNLSMVGGSATLSGAVVTNGFYMSGGSFNGSSTIGDDPTVQSPYGIEFEGGTIGGTHNLGSGYILFGGGNFTGTINCTMYNGGNGDEGVYFGYSDPWGSGNRAEDFAANGNITGRVFVEGGTFRGNHTIVGDVLVSNTYGPVTFAGASNITGNVTLGSNYATSAVTFTGSHTIHGNLSVATGNTQHVTIAPNNEASSAGTLTVVGNVTLDSNTTLNFSLASPGTSGSGINDLIDITGNLTLDGTLNVNNLSGFGAGTYRLFNYTGTLTNNLLAQGVMPATYTYTIDTSTAGQVNLGVVTPYIEGDTDHSGGSTLNSLDIDAIYHHFGQAYTTQWKVAQDTNPVGQEDVTYELTHLMHTNYGDANLDRFTDFTDFQVLLDHWQAPGGWAQGDFNGDSVVDFLDFQVLLDYWNPGGWNAGASQVPEPATLTLLALGGLALLRRSRK